MNKWETHFNRLWMLFMTLFLCSVRFEQKLFDHAFESAISYVYIILVWLGVLLLMYSIGKNLSTQTIHIILTICAILVSLVWLYYAAALPSSDLLESDCKNWDCHLMLQLATGSIS